jgi:L-lactate dehydrogenase complex protein LldG
VSAARERVLGRIRTALGRTAPLPHADAEPLQAYLAARPIGPQPRRREDLVAQFRDCALRASTTIDAVETDAAPPAAVARYLRSQGLPPAAVVWPELARLPWREAGIAVAIRKADANDAVGITGAFCALAETGTLVQLSGPHRPASTSLLPPTHVAVLPVQRIVATMEDAWALLRTEQGALPRAVNLISGPSRTADIEQTLVLGAHGPCRVHVVLTQG